MEIRASRLPLNTLRFFLSSARYAPKTPTRSATMQLCFTAALPAAITPTHHQAISSLRMHPDKKVQKCGVKASMYCRKPPTPLPSGRATLPTTTTRTRWPFYAPPSTERFQPTLCWPREIGLHFRLPGLATHSHRSTSAF